MDIYDIETFITILKIQIRTFDRTILLENRLK